MPPHTMRRWYGLEDNWALGGVSEEPSTSNAFPRGAIGEASDLIETSGTLTEIRSYLSAWDHAQGGQ